MSNKAADKEIGKQEKDEHDKMDNSHGVMGRGPKK